MLHSVCDGIWAAHDGMYMPGKLMHFHLRMTIVKLPDETLMLISPIPMDDALAAEIDALGTVAHIVAPNNFHHLYAGAAKERYPNARLYGSRGLNRKRKDLPIEETLNDQAPEAWATLMDQRVVQGSPGMNEVVFYHRPTRTLIVTDLVFNIHEYKGLLTGMILRMVGAHRRVGQSRLWRFITKNREDAGASVRKILEFDIQRVIMAHGEIVEREARASLSSGLYWMLGKPRTG